MKPILIITLLFFQTFSFCQFAKSRLGFSYNIDVWKPYTQVTQAYIADGGQIKSSTWNLSLEIPIYTTKKYSIYSGLSYQRINHIIIDKTTHWQTYYGVTYEFKDPLDLKSNSNKAGIVLGFDYLMISKKKLSHFIGLTSELYFIDRYNSYYFTTDKTQHYNSKDHIPASLKYNSPYIYGGKLFRISTFNFSTFYKILLIANDKINFGLKATLGLNLYSDWDQFKRYGWLGLGLEMGFGRKKVNEKVVE